MILDKQLMPSNFYEFFRHETCGSNNDSKISKFWAKKKCRIDNTQEMLMTFNDSPDLLKMVLTGEKSWMYGYDIETKAESS